MFTFISFYIINHQHRGAMFGVSASNINDLNPSDASQMVEPSEIYLSGSGIAFKYIGCLWFEIVVSSICSISHSPKT